MKQDCVKVKPKVSTSKIHLANVTQITLNLSLSSSAFSSPVLLSSIDSASRDMEKLSSLALLSSMLPVSSTEK